MWLLEFSENMNSDDLALFETWFQDYVDRFQLEDPVVRLNMDIKREHSRNVCSNIRLLGEELELDREQQLLAMTMALFHDMGRFRQMSEHRSYDDLSTGDHAKLSVQVLEEEGVLRTLPDVERDLVYKAISYHNALRVPEDETPDVLFFSRLLRDADKLDSWRVGTGYFETQRENPNPMMALGFPQSQDYSTEVVADIMASGCVHRANVQSFCDIVLAHIAWVFDLNFAPSFRLLEERGYVERLFVFLPDTRDLKRVKGHVWGYIKGKLSEH